MKCTLVIEDEVNCRFKDLDIVTRRKLSNKVKFMLPYARHTPAFKMGRWDGMVRFCDIGGRTYINALDDLVPIVQEAGYEIEIQDLRENHQFDFESIDENTYSHFCWPEGHRYAGEPIKIMDHQVIAINEYLKTPQSVQSISTGAGKTIVTAILSNKCEKYGRTIVIVPSKDLVTQTEEQYQNLGLDVGVFFGDRKEYGKTHTICTWQSLESLNKKSKDFDPEIDINEFVDGVVCVMVDECFHGDTLILTPDGKKPIKSLKEGDKVINFCETTKQYKEDTIVKVHKNLLHSDSEKMLELEFDNGVKTQVTANHKFLTNKGWVRADELTDDLEIIDIDTYRD